MARPFKAAPAAAATALALSVGACGHNSFSTYSWGPRHYANLSERDCMARAMYFESNRSSEEGMKAVGTVVMNRVKSGQYAGNICGVVGAPRQFAPGVLSKPVSGASWALAQRSADRILAGERHARVGRAMHFHTAGYTFPYRNMAYVVAAGGNVFYEKKTPGTFTPVHPNILVAEAARRPRPSETILLARAEEPAPVAVVRPIERQAEPTRLASVEPREVRREVHAAPVARIPRHRDAEIAEEAPRNRQRGERIRLAHLDDTDLPKAVRSQSDAVRGPLGGMPLSYKSQARPEPAKATAAKADAPKSSTASRAPIRAEPVRIEPVKTAQAKLPAKPATMAAEQPLSYREAGTKPAPADPAKLGWKRGPAPAASVGEKNRKKS